MLTVQGTHLGEYQGVEILPEPHSHSPVPTHRAHLSGKEGFTNTNTQLCGKPVWHLRDIANILVAP